VCCSADAFRPFWDGAEIDLEAPKDELPESISSSGSEQLSSDDAAQSTSEVDLVSIALQPVILSGGSGTRLWPLSREKYPKQLLALGGDQTMLQATATRLAGFGGAGVAGAEGDAVKGIAVGEPIVVCNEEYRFVTAEQLRAAGCGRPRIVLEPAGRNTAPALTLAALVARAGGEDPVLLVMPADHVILDKAAFHAAIAAGLPAARGGAIVTFGIVPDRPETGYGYIQVGGEFAGGSPAGTAPRRLKRFVEKPDAATAADYLASGEYLWNSGLFMLRASTWLAAIGRFDPGIAAACEQAIAGAREDIDFLRVDAEAFRGSPSDSIDYAVMEKLGDEAASGAGAAAGAEAPAACVVPMSAGWSDVGAWDAVWQVGEKDEAGNSVQGEVLLEDTEGTFAMSTSRLVACLGLKDAVVVETPDAVLVADKAHTQKIRNLVARIKARGLPQAENHRKVHRPWGYYDSIDGGDRFQVKRIVVKPGASLSLQMHHHRAEHWVVVRGTAKVTVGDRTIILSENQSTYIPIGERHRLENPGKLDLEIIEVQSGAYLGEDDIVRFEDVYGRRT
jgi:mannose-1-phosphate guanylyltransferase/mannose-6-phosphate isomerase